MQKICVCKHDEGVIRVAWGPGQVPILYSASVDGTVRVWDGRDGKCERIFTGHVEPILDMVVRRYKKKKISFEIEK
jgi:WD40 repeat protein